MYVVWKALRWLIGYAEFEIRGAYAERFLTLCMEKDIDMWDIRRLSPGIICVRVFRFSLPHLEGLARKSGVVLEELRRKGFPEVLYRYRRRPGLLIGFCLYCALMCLLPCFVWSVEIPDVDPIRAKRIRTALLEEGFGVGSFVPSVDFRGLKYHLMICDDEISFVSVNMQGSRAVLEVRFAEDTPEIQPDTPCNIVASRDGEILSVLVKNGVRYVQKGQTVRQGDLLVGGIVDTRLGYYCVHSDGEILARVIDTVSEKVSLTQTVTERTGRVKVQRFWTFFGTTVNATPWFSCPYDAYDTVTERKYLSFDGENALPVMLTEVYYYETVSYDMQLSPEQAADLARSRLAERDRLRLVGIEVESVREEVTVGEADVTVALVRSLITDICEKKEFYFEDEGY